MFMSESAFQHWQRIIARDATAAVCGRLELQGKRMEYDDAIDLYEQLVLAIAWGLSQLLEEEDKAREKRRREEEETQMEEEGEK